MSTSRRQHWSENKTNRECQWHDNVFAAGIAESRARVTCQSTVRSSVWLPQTCKISRLLANRSQTFRVRTRADLYYGTLQMLRVSIQTTAQNSVIRPTSIWDWWVRLQSMSINHRLIFVQFICIDSMSVDTFFNFCGLSFFAILREIIFRGLFHRLSSQLVLVHVIQSNSTLTYIKLISYINAVEIMDSH